MKEVNSLTKCQEIMKNLRKKICEKNKFSFKKSPTTLKALNKLEVTGEIYQCLIIELNPW